VESGSNLSCGCRNAKIAKVELDDEEKDRLVRLHGVLGADYIAQRTRLTKERVVQAIFQGTVPAHRVELVRKFLQDTPDKLTCIRCETVFPCWRREGSSKLPRMCQSCALVPKVSRGKPVAPTPAVKRPKERRVRERRMAAPEKQLLSYLLAYVGWIEWDVLSREAEKSGVSSQRARDMLATDLRFESHLGPTGVRWKKRESVLEDSSAETGQPFFKSYRR
jgi:hypothetical protein